MFSRYGKCVNSGGKNMVGFVPDIILNVKFTIPSVPPLYKCYRNTIGEHYRNTPKTRLNFEVCSVTNTTGTLLEEKQTEHYPLSDTFTTLKSLTPFNPLEEVLLDNK